jgi:UDP-N-acetylmuramate-alanine ligase
MYDKDFSWRVMDGDDRVVAQRCTREEAEEIAAAHNARDPIQSRDQWLFYRGV